MLRFTNCILYLSFSFTAVPIIILFYTTSKDLTSKAKAKNWASVLQAKNTVTPSLLSTLAASSSKRNTSITVCPSVCPDVFLTLIGRAVHTQRNSPGGSTRRGQCTFPSEYYEDGRTAAVTTVLVSVNQSIITITDDVGFTNKKQYLRVHVGNVDSHYVAEFAGRFDATNENGVGVLDDWRAPNGLGR